MARHVILHQYWSFNYPFALMRKSMLVKKFFINTGINICKNKKWALLKKSSPTPLRPPSKFHSFLNALRRLAFSIFTSYKPLTIRSKQVEFISSLKWTVFHCSSVHTICSVAKSRRTFWFFFEIKSLRHGVWATNFSLFNLRETVFLEIGFPVCSRNEREIDVAISKRSFKDILAIITSSRLVVIGGLPVLAFGSSVLSALNLLITQ